LSLTRSIGGLVASLIGWAMWQNTHLDWDSLVSLGVGEFYRMVNDPFAILGLVIMFLGIATLVRTSTSAAD